MSIAQPTGIAGDVATAGTRRLVSGAFMLRMLLLLLALAVACMYSFNRLMRRASLQGVVNAPIVTLRAPIDGKLISGVAAVGQAIMPGTDLFVVRDPRVDEHRKLSLRTRLDDTGHRITALDENLNDLDRMALELRGRVAAYAGAEETRLRAAIQGQETAIANAIRAREFSRQQEERAVRLVGAGTAVQKRLEDARRAHLAAQTALDAAIAERRTSLAALDAVTRQIFVQNGFAGAAYPQQKHDEIQVRRMELRYQRTMAVAEAASLETELAAETARIDASREVTVPTSVGGVVASVYVSAGSDALRGNALADVLDCSSLYIEATVSTGWFTTPKPGDRVEVELYGSGGTVEGRIRALRATAMALDPARGTPLSDRDNRQTLTALIDGEAAVLAASGSGRCPVGQPARVGFR